MTPECASAFDPHALALPLLLQRVSATFGKTKGSTKKQATKQATKKAGTTKKKSSGGAGPSWVSASSSHSR